MSKPENAPQAFTADDYRAVLSEARDFIRLMTGGEYSVVVANIETALAATPIFLPTDPSPVLQVTPIAHVSEWTARQLRAGHEGEYRLTIKDGQVALYAAPPQEQLAGREAAMRKAGQIVIDDLIDRGGWCIASDDDLADYMTRIVDACVRAATTESQP